MHNQDCPPPPYRPYIPCNIHIYNLTFCDYLLGPATPALISLGTLAYVPFALSEAAPQPKRFRIQWKPLQMRTWFSATPGDGVYATQYVLCAIYLLLRIMPLIRIPRSSTECPMLSLNCNQAKAPPPLWKPSCWGCRHPILSSSNVSPSRGCSSCSKMFNGIHPPTFGNPHADSIVAPTTTASLFVRETTNVAVTFWDIMARNIF